MPGESVMLTINPDGVTVRVVPGTTALEALAQAGISVTAPCGHRARCGKCRVVFETGALPPSDTEQAILSPEELAGGWRLACQTPLMADATVLVPPASRAAEMRVMVGGTPRQVPFDPAVVKKPVRWTGQPLGEAVSGFDHLCRLMDARADLSADLERLRILAAIPPGPHAEITGVVCEDRLIALEPGDTSSRCYGIACDVGTTTVVGTLVDLVTGRDAGTASAVNRQTRYGHDVISRIHYTLEHDDGLERLQQAVVDTVNLIVEKLIAAHGVSPDDVYEMTMVGNTTMMHLLLGINPRSLGFLPYVPVSSHPLNADARTLGIRINPAASVHVLPNIAGFVGADTVAALLAAGMDEDDAHIRMLADVGTNCEIALRHDGRIIACSTPAGPAFEGARIRHGMYAGPGAIERVALDDDCVCKVIGRAAPQGICGSGLVDIGAELLRTGLMDETGRLLPAEELDGGVSAALRARMVEQEGEPAFVMAETGAGRRIVLTQRDIRELQLAKAAIRTGIDALLDAHRLRPPDISTFYLAGGFGSYINKAHAVRLGMIPEMPLDRIRFIGNAAAVGAKLALVSQEIRRKALRVARHTEHLQIAETPDFQSRFADAMIFEAP